MRHGRRFVGALGLGLLLLAALLFAADTRMGHRFVVDRIEALEPRNGLRIGIDRIDGSLYGHAQIKGLTLRDERGVFFVADHVDLDWTPLAWFLNRLDIRRLHAAKATLHRLPSLRPAPPGTPLLLDYDIRIDKLDIDRLTIRPGVSGRPQMGQISGRADIRDGRALIAALASTTQGDRLILNFDSIPDQDRFDLRLALDAPAQGTLGAMLGTRLPLQLRLDGDGAWRAWRGMFLARLNGAEVARLAFTNKAGLYGLSGQLEAAALPAGRVRSLAAPRLILQGTARFTDRRLKGALTGNSSALSLKAEGGVNFASSSFEDLLITSTLRDVRAIAPTMSGPALSLKLRLDGAFRQAAFDYLLTAPMLKFGTTGLEQMRASGQGRLSQLPIRIPVQFSARRITGVGDVAGGILANISAQGILLASRQSLVGEDIQLRSDKLSGKIGLFYDIKTGRFDVGFAGRLSRYFVPGIGLVDVQSDFHIVPGPNGRGTRVLGTGKAWVRRFDNSFLAGLAGGLPRLETALERTTDGQLRFTNMRILAPRLSLVLNGVRRADGSFALSGSGQQSTYGPLTLMLDGQISRPRLRLVFTRPNAAMALANVHLDLDPTPQGFDWRAQGGSRLGVFIGTGSIALPQNAPAQIQIAMMEAGGIQATGLLRPITGGLAGTITLVGAATGTLQLDVENGLPRIRADVDARNAKLSGPTALAVQRGRFVGTILLDPRGTAIEGHVTARNLQYGGFGVARLAGSLRMAAGRGEVRGSIAGSRGRDFDVDATVRFNSDRVTMSGRGTIDRLPVALDAPAQLLKEGGGWRLAPARLTYGGGAAELSGLIGGDRPEVKAVLSSLPLAILDIVVPDLGLTGQASGTFFYAEEADGDPSGRADLKVRGLSRAGLALTARPVDLAVLANFANGRAGARLVAASGGVPIGRGQVQLTGLSGNGSLASRIAKANLIGQLRYNGDAGALWRLSGIESFDLSGNVAVGMDVTGRLSDPLIRGSVRTASGRIESASLGMVLTNVAAFGRFNGSRLVIENFAANAGRGGRVNGSGTIGFSAGQPTMDLAVDAENAQIIARDDLAAAVTGPLRIVSNSNGGTIKGSVRLTRSLYVLGRSDMATALPRLKVTEVNDGRVDAPVIAPALPWTLDIKADAPSRLMVTGLGLDSEWRASLILSSSLLAPTITGTAELVRGSYEFSGRRFDLQRGAIRFRGESPPDPLLDIVAGGDTQGLNATIRVSGTGQHPEFAFASVPALPQEELLSRLLFGTSITNLSAPEAVQLAAAIASMQGGAGLNPINALRKAIGLDRLRILPADLATGQRTSIAAGKYLTRRTFVEIVTDGQGYSATRAEFQVTRWLSILSTISTIGEQGASVRVSRDY